MEKNETLDALYHLKKVTHAALEDSSRELDLDTSLMLHECWNCLHDLEDFFDDDGTEDMRSTDNGC